MFLKLKSDFGYWVIFSSAFWDFHVKTFFIAKFSDVYVLRVCMSLISKNRYRSLSLITLSVRGTLSH